MTRLCSANEAFHLARKACLGAGLNMDRAEDLAQATTLLQCNGHVGLDGLHQLLVRHQQASNEIALSITLHSDGLLIDSLRPEKEGIAVIDWLVANKDKGRVEISLIFDLMMFAGLLLLATHNYGGCFRLQHKDGDSAFDIASAKPLPDLPNLKNWVLCYDSDLVANRAVCHHTPVRLQVWQALEKLAHRTYVPASETSRQTGAGAGQVDND